MRFRFIHASDLHLDTPFLGIEQVDGDLARRLRDASLDALSRIVDKAIEVEAAFVVFAGDLYDGVERGVRAQLRFKASLSRLASHGIQSFVAHGNHDPEAGRWTAIRKWPDGVTVFPPESVLSVPVRLGDSLLATVHGISYGSRREADNLARRFERPTDGGVHIGVLHCSVDRHPGHANYSPCSLDDLRSRRMTYWALGHVHRRAVLSEEPWIVYSGNTQGRSIHAGERGKKGATIVEIEAGAVRSIEFFPTDTARFVQVSIDISAADDLAGIADLLRAEAETLTEEHDGVDLLLRARLTGRSRLHRDVKSPLQRAEILEALRDLSAQRVWWLDLENHAGPELDLEQIRLNRDLRAAVLEAWEGWPAEETGDAALPSGLVDAFDGVGEPPPELFRELLDEAAQDVLERLSPDRSS